MTIQQRAQIERAFDEYMPLYNRFNQMNEIGRKYGFDGGVGK
ncbi:hypothetical protein [Paenibacillus sp. MER 180]|nr:hypothetical protein [Paenibacillus sp. MER 180]